MSIPSHWQVLFSKEEIEKAEKIRCSIKTNQGNKENSIGEIEFSSPSNKVSLLDKHILSHLPKLIKDTFISYSNFTNQQQNSNTISFNSSLFSFFSNLIRTKTELGKKENEDFVFNIVGCLLLLSKYISPKNFLSNNELILLLNESIIDLTNKRKSALEVKSKYEHFLIDMIFSIYQFDYIRVKSLIEQLTNPEIYSNLQKPEINVLNYIKYNLQLVFDFIDSSYMNINNIGNSYKAVYSHYEYENFYNSLKEFESQITDQNLLFFNQQLLFIFETIYGNVFFFEERKDSFDVLFAFLHCSSIEKISLAQYFLKKNKSEIKNIIGNLSCHDLILRVFLSDSYEEVLVNTLDLNNLKSNFCFSFKFLFLFIFNLSPDRNENTQSNLNSYIVRLYSILNDTENDLFSVVDDEIFLAFLDSSVAEDLEKERFLRKLQWMVRKVKESNVKEGKDNLFRFIYDKFQRQKYFKKYYFIEKEIMIQVLDLFIFTNQESDCYESFEKFHFLLFFFEVNHFETKVDSGGQYLNTDINNIILNYIYKNILIEETFNSEDIVNRLLPESDAFHKGIDLRNLRNIRLVDEISNKAIDFSSKNKYFSSFYNMAEEDEKYNILSSYSVSVNLSNLNDLSLSLMALQTDNQLFNQYDSLFCFIKEQYNSFLNFTFFPFPRLLIPCLLKGVRLAFEGKSSMNQIGYSLIRLVQAYMYKSFEPYYLIEISKYFVFDEEECQIRLFYLKYLQKIENEIEKIRNLSSI